ncbi:MAG: hypothetical protein M0P17_10680 [Methanoculleus sp.]|nr:hypothetical protein [Methanoculleus sp.]
MFCKGTLHEGTAELIARVGDEIIVIRDVPTSATVAARRTTLQRSRGRSMP